MIPMHFHGSAIYLIVRALGGQIITGDSEVRHMLGWSLLWVLGDFGLTRKCPLMC